jgi:hypothetical protein
MIQTLFPNNYALFQDDRWNCVLKYATESKEGKNRKNPTSSSEKLNA